MKIVGATCFAGLWALEGAWLIREPNKATESKAEITNF